MDAIDRERTYKEIKVLFYRTVENSNCPASNEALNRVTKFLLDVCLQEGQNPLEYAKELCNLVSTPGSDKGALMARRLFFYLITGERFSGG